MYIGIDIGGTKCAVTLADKSGERIISKIKFPTDAPRGHAAVCADIVRAVNGIIKENDCRDRVISAGVSCGGPLDSKRGVILSPPNLPDWDGVPITDIIERGCGVKTYLQNDANACALAEWKFGAGRGCGNMIFLTFGTGMGAGLILNGRLYSGANDMAGEVGHIRLAADGPEGYGKHGSFEGFCSGGGIERYANAEYLRVSGREPEERLTAAYLAEKADGGDAFALKIYRDCGEKLGEGLAVLVDVLNPELIVIGSVFARAERLLRDSMEQSLRREALPVSLGACRIVPSLLGENLGDMAAIGVAMLGSGMKHEG